MTQSDRIAKARMGIILEAPFFGALLMRLKMVRDDRVPTFCTDGTVIRYREEFCAGLSDGELRFVLVHEVAHCAQGHLWRRGAREPRRWNVAADYQINLMLHDYVEEQRAARAGRNYLDPWTLPTGRNAGLLDPQYRGMATEEIYARLPENAGGEGGGGQPGEGESACSIGEFVDAPGDGATDPDGQPCATEGDWQVAAAQAATVAKMRGQLPASLRRFLDEALAPKVSWREVLREFVRKLARDDYSWQRPNRRFLSTGFSLPSMLSYRMGRIVIARDTSGSTAPFVQEFNAEVQAALDECKPEEMAILDCDAEIAKVHEIKPGDLVPRDIHGGGRTRFEPVFDWIEKHCDEPPEALIYLTDLYGSFPAQAPDYPVLWAVWGDCDTKPPFGEVVAIR